MEKNFWNLDSRGESAKFYISIFYEFRNRGLGHNLIISVEKLTEFYEPIGACYTGRKSKNLSSPKQELFKAFFLQRPQKVYLFFKDNINNQQYCNLPPPVEKRNQGKSCFHQR